MKRIHNDNETNLKGIRNEYETIMKRIHNDFETNDNEIIKKQFTTIIKGVKS